VTDSEAFRLGMRHLAAGVTIVTARSAAGRTGMTASAVCSVSAEPPQLLVCVNKQASPHDPIAESGRFCINLLTRAHVDLAMRFAGFDDVEGEDRFTLGDWREGTAGVPVLGDGLVSFECEIAQALDVGTHTIFVGAVQAVHINASRDPESEPLLYSDGAFAALRGLPELS
jgi:flavin reductase (DIM6/NTAB) family NADH-FMN oxidoreductase RutF